MKKVIMITILGVFLSNIAYADETTSSKCDGLTGTFKRYCINNVTYINNNKRTAIVYQDTSQAIIEKPVPKEDENYFNVNSFGILGLLILVLWIERYSGEQKMMGG